MGNPGTVAFYEVTDASADDMSDEEKAEAKKAAEAAGLSDSSAFNLVMDGNALIDAQVMTQKDSYGNSQYVVELTMNAEGAEKFKEATARNIGKPIYIVYDNEVISYPKVNTTIENGQAIIEGNFTYESASSLATYIRLGA